MKLDTQLLAEVTAFLNMEADLLDNKDYRDWLKLWGPSGMYIIPVDHNATDYKNTLNVVYDDAEMRNMRVNRLLSGEAVSTIGAEKTVRVPSRFRILSDKEGVVTIRCAYCLYENNKNGIRSFPASVQFKLSRDDNEFKIEEKIVKIMKSSEYLSTISYLF